jgi:hypothetical protein
MSAQDRERKLRELDLTPESRGRIAYVAYGTIMHFRDMQDRTLPPFDELLPREQAAWIQAATVIWEFATTGEAEIL